MICLSCSIFLEIFPAKKNQKEHGAGARKIGQVKSASQMKQLAVSYLYVPPPERLANEVCWCFLSEDSDQQLGEKETLYESPAEPLKVVFHLLLLLEHELYCAHEDYEHHDCLQRVHETPPFELVSLCWENCKCACLRLKPRKQYHIL